VTTHTQSNFCFAEQQNKNANTVSGISRGILMAFVANVTLRTKAIGNPFEIPLRLTPCAFACSGKAFDPQKFDAGYALAQDDTLTRSLPICKANGAV
jgi:hypothetical protein